MVTKDKIPVELKFTVGSLRHRAGHKQTDVARLLGVSIETYRKLEKDSSDLNIKQINKLEEIYKVPQDYIFFGKDTDLIGKIEASDQEGGQQ